MSVTKQTLLLIHGLDLLENKFPNLLSLNLRLQQHHRRQVSEVARRCSKLHTLNLTGCGNITDASVSEVARRCSNLQTLDLQAAGNHGRQRL